MDTRRAEPKRLDAVWAMTELFDDRVLKCASILD